MLTIPCQPGQYPAPPSTLALSGRERAGWAVSNDLHPSFKNMSVKRIGESVGVACVELPVHHHIIESASTRTCCMLVSMMIVLILFIFMFMFMFILVVHVHGCSWMFMDVHGCSWMFMDVHGCSWMFMDVHGCSWMFMDVHGCSWMFMDVYFIYAMVQLSTHEVTGLAM
ncbi:hypothetical protein HYPBUDRAFT_202234 [Hyphopichia burtonii NRRL Y-1933]|uniref:Uncharacterized protein n=1 Tax=Hyphopichia burtonii NRRL Y-1933 TaxID=984485 RepID=A0A1E4RLE7_9ASCO|nr:hypothetical protein HYPBUDRAFT_202234 [Hyphopichia burtonii NRRL Y-1933]ODV68088.1 hypothetical protein HYPBUDRAFT_202234 [Hyphopichia burtonii NRRL Y-1933]